MDLVPPAFKPFLIAIRTLLNLHPLKKTFTKKLLLRRNNSGTLAMLAAISSTSHHGSGFINDSLVGQSFGPPLTLMLH
jgi:hypothetical protein